MLTVLAALGVLLVLFVAGVVATREDQALVPAPEEQPDLALPDRALRADDVERVRFGVTVRGYRMSEVDAVLARLATELADRDARLDALSSALMASPDSARGGLEQPAAPADATPLAFPDVVPAEPAPAHPVEAEPAEEPGAPASAPEPADRD